MMENPLCFSGIISKPRKHLISHEIYYPYLNSSEIQSFEDLGIIYNSYETACVNPPTRVYWQGIRNHAVQRETRTPA